MKNVLLTIFSVLIMVQIGNSQCTNTNATTCQCLQANSTDCDLLPDIIVGKPPLLTSGSYGIIEYAYNDSTIEKGRLRVSVSTPNIGRGPLDVRTDSVFVCGTDTIVGTPPAICPNTNLPPNILVKQWIYHKNGNVMTKIQKEAGTMTYHAGHGHMHVDEWGHYTLRKATSNPDPLTWPIVGYGQKLAFCLMDFGTCQTFLGHCVDSNGNTLGNANFPNLGLGGGNFTCNATRQGISSGYTDIYYQYLGGMYIQLDSLLCNGTYWIVVEIDPLNYFTEENEVNNVLAVPYTLTKQRPGITINATGGQSMCVGQQANLSASGAADYTWSPSTGLNQTTGSSVIASPNTTTTYTVVGNGQGAGCSDTKTVTVTITNTATIGVTGNTSVCNNVPVTISANGGSTYTWAPSTGLSATTGTSVTANPSSTTTYTVTGTTSNGCTGTTTVKVTKGNNPTINLTNSTAVCKGTSVTLTASGASTYSWSPSTGLSSISGSTVLANPENTTIYTVTGTNAAGCTATKSVTLTINPIPVINYEPLATSYINTITAVALIATPPGGVFQGIGVSGNTFSPNVAGVGGPYYLSYSVTNQFGCQAAAVRSTSVVYSCLKPTGVTVNNITSNSAQVNWNSASTAATFKIRYKVSSASVWTTKTTPGIPYVTSYNLTGLSPSTTYNVTVRPGCSGTGITSVKRTFTTNASKNGLNIFDNNEDDAVLEIMPNPNSGEFNISFYTDLAGDGDIRITDLTGRLLSSEKIAVVEGENNLWYQMSSYGPGIYFIELTFDNQKYSAKVVLN
ncbi:MAG: fibronectin type III domain-containing protein [Bacteroidetes bacterium]|nr:fibronectin type III domain-containing protein [Bacteroidota bacterium]